VRPDKPGATGNQNPHTSEPSGKSDAACRCPVARTRARITAAPAVVPNRAAAWLPFPNAAALPRSAVREKEANRPAATGCPTAGPP
jgi:hypothetical protein